MELTLLHKAVKSDDIPLNKIIFVMNRNWSLEEQYNETIENKKGIPDYLICA